MVTTISANKCNHIAVATYSYWTQLSIFTKLYHNLIAVFQEHATNHIEEPHIQLDTILLLLTIHTDTSMIVGRLDGRDVEDIGK